MTNTKTQHTPGPWDSQIYFPNGNGFTPCTKEYADLHAEIEALKPDYVRMNDLSPHDYEAYNRLTDKLASLQMSGHIGKSVFW